MTVWLVLAGSDSHDCHRDILLAICASQTEAERLSAEARAKDFYFMCSDGHVVPTERDTCGQRLLGGRLCSAPVHQAWDAGRYEIREVTLGEMIEDVSVDPA